jgi:hypothetical protein
MGVKTVVFRGNHGLLQSGRDVFQGRPVQATPLRIRTKLLDNFSPPVEENRVGLYVSPADFRVGGQGKGAQGKDAESREHRANRSA